MTSIFEELKVTSVVCAILLLATQGFSIQPKLSLSGCICPGSNLTLECSIEGSGTTIWKGNFIRDCSGSPEILFRHMNNPTEFTQLSQICNNGAITATALSVNNNTYTSWLSINTTMISLINGSNVTCAHDDGNNRVKIIDTWTMIDPPINLHLGYANRTYLNFSWNSVHPSSPSLHYNVRTTNCGTCSMNSNSTTVLCDNFNVRADIQVCSIAIQRRCDDNSIGNMSDISQVILKVPEAPFFAHMPSYYWNNSENKLMLNVTLNKTVAFKVSDDIDGSATSYTIEYSDSTSSTGFNDSVTIPASSCRSSVCNHVFKIANSFCSSSDISVTVFATNVFGDGPHSSANAVRLETSVSENIYGVLAILLVNAAGGGAAFIVFISVVICCYWSSKHRQSGELYEVEFYVQNKSGSLASALQHFKSSNINLDFVDTCPPNAKYKGMKGFHVSYHCSSIKHDNISSLLEKSPEIKLINVRKGIGDDQEEDLANDIQFTHIVVRFSVRDEKGRLADVVKALGDLNISIDNLKGGERSGSERQFTVECLCSFESRIIITDRLQKNGANKLTIIEEVPLSPPTTNTEYAIIEFQIDNRVGSLAKILSKIQSSCESNDYELCHVKMNTHKKGMHSVHIVCTYPRGKEEQLESDIENATERKIQMCLVEGKPDHVALPLVSILIPDVEEHNN